MNSLSNHDVVALVVTNIVLGAAVGGIFLWICFDTLREVWRRRRRSEERVEAPALRVKRAEAVSS